MNIFNIVFRSLMQVVFIVIALLIQTQLSCAGTISINLISAATGASVGQTATVGQSYYLTCTSSTNPNNHNCYFALDANSYFYYPNYAPSLSSNAIPPAPYPAVCQGVPCIGFQAPSKTTPSTPTTAYPALLIWVTDTTGDNPLHASITVNPVLSGSLSIQISPTPVVVGKTYALTCTDVINSHNCYFAASYASDVNYPSDKIIGGLTAATNSTYCPNASCVLFQAGQVTTTANGPIQIWALDNNVPSTAPGASTSINITVASSSTPVPPPTPSQNKSPSFFVIGVFEPPADMLLPIGGPNGCPHDYTLPSAQAYLATTNDNCSMLKWKSRGINTVVGIPLDGGTTWDPTVASNWKASAINQNLWEIRAPIGLTDDVQTNQSVASQSTALQKDLADTKLLAWDAYIDEPDLGSNGKLDSNGDLASNGLTTLQPTLATYQALKSIPGAPPVYLNLSGGDVYNRSFINDTLVTIPNNFGATCSSNSQYCYSWLQAYGSWSSQMTDWIGFDLYAITGWAHESFIDSTESPGGDPVYTIGGTVNVLRTYSEGGNITSSSPLFTTSNTETVKQNGKSIFAYIETGQQTMHGPATGQGPDDYNTDCCDQQYYSSPVTPAYWNNCWSWLPQSQRTQANADLFHSQSIGRFATFLPRDISRLQSVVAQSNPPGQYIPNISSVPTFTSMASQPGSSNFINYRCNTTAAQKNPANWQQEGLYRLWMATPDEFRGEIWTAIVHGANGIIYFPQDPFSFAWDNTDQLTQAEMIKQNTFLNYLSTVLISNGYQVQINEPMEAAVRTTAAGNNYSIILNMSHQMEVISATVGSVTVSKMTFTPYEVKVFKNGALIGDLCNTSNSLCTSVPLYSSQT